MRLPKLTPLQSRFAASFLASIVLIILYFALSGPTFAYAQELDSRIHEDHNHPLSPDLSGLVADQFWVEETPDVDVYEPVFPGMDRGIVGRAVVDNLPELGNNAPQSSNLNAGQSMNYWIPKEVIFGNKSAPGIGLPSPVDSQYEGLTDNEVLHAELRKRQEYGSGNGTIYITLNTCLQPAPNSSTVVVAPPQLEIYVATSQNNRKPGPGSDESSQRVLQADGGFVGVQMDAESDVFVGVTAPNNTDFQGIYNFELAISIDAPYHAYDDDDAFLFFIDSDSNAALLVTNNVTQAPPGSPLYDEWMNISPPFTIYGQNQNDTSILGLHKSGCGLRNMAQIQASKNGLNTNNVRVGMTDRGIGNRPKEQFYVNSLNGSSAYYGFLAMEGNSTMAGGGVVGGGGKVWKAMNFTTKSGRSSIP